MSVDRSPEGTGPMLKKGRGMGPLTALPTPTVRRLSFPSTASVRISILSVPRHLLRPK